MSNRDRAIEIMRSFWRDGRYAVGFDEIAEALDDAGLLADNLPKATINPVDGNPEWKPKEFHLVEVDWGEVTYWIEGQPFTNTPKEAREIARSLEAAADYAEEEALEGEEK